MFIFKDTSTDAIETLYFSMKEVNARKAYSSCPPSVSHQVKISWIKAFSNVDVLFFACKTCGPTIPGMIV